MMQIIQGRRRFLAGLSAAAAAAIDPRTAFADEGPPETTTIRLGKIAGICLAPQYAVEELLRVEGFTDVQYVPAQPGPGIAKGVASGELDFSMNFAAPLVVAIDAGEPIKIVAGIHPGCFELFANERIRSLLDLKGKSVGVQGLGSTPHIFLAAMATYVGLDPVNDINWIKSTSARPKELFIEGRIDAFLGFAPEPQELRDRGIGRVILNSAMDRPWSQYFCCLLSGNADFVASPENSGGAGGR